jgi:hypothetical protein
MEHPKDDATEAMIKARRSHLRRLAATVPGARRAVEQVRRLRRARAERAYLRLFARDCYACFWGSLTSFEVAARPAHDT